jgi:hypothetical protein
VSAVGDLLESAVQAPMNGHLSARLPDFPFPLPLPFPRPGWVDTVVVGPAVVGTVVLGVVVAGAVVVGAVVGEVVAAGGRVVAGDVVVVSGGAVVANSAAATTLANIGAGATASTGASGNTTAPLAWSISGGGLSQHDNVVSTSSGQPKGHEETCSSHASGDTDT